MSATRKSASHVGSKTGAKTPCHGAPGKALRAKYGLDKVNVAGRSALPDEDLEKIIKYLKDSGISPKSAADFVSSPKIMEKISKIICRWPRPSELVRLVKLVNPDAARSDISVFRVNMRVVSNAGGNFSKIAAQFVGKNGVHFKHVTETHKCLYIYLKGDTLKIYALKESDATAAAKALQEHLRKIAKKAADASSSSAKSPIKGNWADHVDAESLKAKMKDALFDLKHEDTKKVGVSNALSVSVQNASLSSSPKLDAWIVPGEAASLFKSKAAPTIRYGP